MLAERAFLDTRSTFGRLVIGGTDATRQRLDRVRRRALRHQLDDRETGAAQLRSEYAIDRDLGYLVAPEGAFATDDVVHEARLAVGDRDAAVARSASGKSALASRFTDRVQAESPLLRLALDERLITTVSRYLGVVPILDQADFWFSSHPGDSVYRDSQLFHTDWEATSKVRVFVYATDVAADDGPLTLVDAQRSAEIKARIRYRHMQVRGDRLLRATSHRVPDQLVPGPWTELIGPAGTVALVDTSRCLHFGSRIAPGRTRIVAVVQYLPPSSFKHSFAHLDRAPFKNLEVDGLCPLQAMVLGATSI